MLRCYSGVGVLIPLLPQEKINEDSPFSIKMIFFLLQNSYPGIPWKEHAAFHVLQALYKVLWQAEIDIPKFADMAAFLIQENPV